MRNILAHVSRKEKEMVAAKLKLICKAPDRKAAQKLMEAFCEEFESIYPDAVSCQIDGFEDSVQFYDFEQLDSRKTSSTNALERLNEEIRRRLSVVSIFPSTDSYIRLITSYLIEYSEDWQSERSYISAEALQSCVKFCFQQHEFSGFFRNEIANLYGHNLKVFLLKIQLVQLQYFLQILQKCLLDKLRTLLYTI